MTPRRHGKTEWRWCDACGTLLLGEKCDRCSSTGRPFSVSLPGDVRPALRKGAENVRRLFMKIKRFMGSSFRLHYATRGFFQASDEWLPLPVRLQDVRDSFFLFQVCQDIFIL